MLNAFEVLTRLVQQLLQSTWLATVLEVMVSLYDNEMGV